MPLFTVYFFGPLKVVLNDATGEVVSVQDRITGASADFAFAPGYIDAAKRHAFLNWSACTDSCV